MLTSVTLGYCDDLTSARSEFKPVVRFFVDALGIVRYKVMKHGNFDPVTKEIIDSILTGNQKITKLESVIDLFSNPHCSIQVLETERE